MVEFKDGYICNNQYIKIVMRLNRDGDLMSILLLNYKNENIEILNSIHAKNKEGDFQIKNIKDEYINI